MILEQYYLGCLAHASYLIGDAETGIAAVVDPQRDVDGYIEDAAKLGLTIKHVFLSHFHADFIAGHLELRFLGFHRWARSGDVLNHRPRRVEYFLFSWPFALARHKQNQEVPPQL